MVQQPVWFLGVDGVVNAINPSPARDETYKADWVGGYLVRWRPIVVNFINQVSRDGRARVVWLTTWGEAAVNRLGPALGFDTFDVAVTQPPNGPGVNMPWARSWWKYQAVSAHTEAQPGTPVVWADDYILRRNNPFTEPENVLPVIPEPWVGLTDTDLDTINAFLGWPT